MNHIPNFFPSESLFHCDIKNYDQDYKEFNKNYLKAFMTNNNVGTDCLQTKEENSLYMKRGKFLYELVRSNEY